MKKISFIYWISTILFAGLMLVSAIPDALSTTEAVTFMNSLGYPAYIIPFIGIMKILGVAAILIPHFNRIKEWAYAGLFFDLLGAIYSLIAKFGVNLQMSMMLVWVGAGIVSYIYFHKKLQAQPTIA